MPSPVLATRLIRPFTLMFFRSLDIKNIQPKVLYLLRTSAGQCHTICTLSSFSSLHNWQSCHCASPILNIWALGVVWPVNSPTATWSFCLLIAWGPFVLLDAGSLIRVSDWRHPLQVFHLFWCSCLKWLLMTSLSTTKGMPTIWSGATPLVPSLANLSAFLFPGIPWCPGIHTKMTLLYPLSFSSACVLSHTRANTVGFLQVLLFLPCSQSSYIF